MDPELCLASTPRTEPRHQDIGLYSHGVAVKRTVYSIDGFILPDLGRQSTVAYSCQLVSLSARQAAAKKEDGLGNRRTYEMCGIRLKAGVIVENTHTSKSPTESETAS